MKKIYLLSIFLFSLVSSQAQEVSFTADTQTIQEGSYEDCVVDMNGDFLDDIVRVLSDGIKVYFQQENGGFLSQKFDITLSNYPTWSACAGDLNGDGYNDLLFGSGSTVSFILSQNEGASYVEQVMPEYIFSQRSSMFDIDNDGDLDAFVCHDVDQSRPYRNDGTGHMTFDLSLMPTANLAGNYSVLWVDYDNDWNTDLFITKCRQGSTSGDIERTNLMYHNNGDGTFTEVGADINMDDNAQSWCTVFEDFDNDGDFDAFIVNHDFKNRFMLNNGDGTFTDIIDNTGIDPYDLGAWENTSADFNNDGYPDILSQMSKELYLNNGDLTFTAYDMYPSNGALGDLNNDGFVDIVSGGTIYFNNGNSNNWITINTEGIESNKNGIGANVAIYGSWGKQMKEVRSTQSFSPLNSMGLHFGIGQATEIDSIVVKWPSREKTTVVSPNINTSITIVEASCLLAGTEIQLSGPTEICEGSSVTLTAPEGFSSFIWSNGETTPSIEVNSPGNYSLISKDEEGCSSLSNKVVVSYVIDQQPVIELAGDNIFCQGGAATLNLIEGSNPVWSNGMTGNSIEVTESGTYTVTTEAICQDGITSEPITITSLETPMPSELEVEFSGVLNETATLSLTGDQITWYADFELQNEIGSGSPWVTPPVTEDTYYFATNSMDHPGGFQQGGKPDITGSGGTPSTFAYSYFDAWETFFLKSVDVFVPDFAPEGQRTIQLMTAENEKLEEVVVDVVHGLNTIDLNWQIPEGTNLSLRCPETELFRNDGGVNYPYPLGDVGEITTSIYGNDYYYFFYNWIIKNKDISCTSEALEVQIQLVDVKEIPELNEFSIAPNPATEWINTEFSANEAGQLDFYLFDATGKEVKHIRHIPVNTGNNKKAINVNGLARGVYNLQITMNGHQSSVKIILQ